MGEIKVEGRLIFESWWVILIIKCLTKSTNNQCFQIDSSTALLSGKISKEKKE